MLSEKQRQKILKLIAEYGAPKPTRAPMTDQTREALNDGTPEVPYGSPRWSTLVLAALERAEAERDEARKSIELLKDGVVDAIRDHRSTLADRDAALARVGVLEARVKVLEDVLMTELSVLSPAPTVPEGWLTLDQAPLNETGSVWSPKMPDRLDMQGMVYAYNDGSREVNLAMARGVTFTHWAPFRPAPTVKGEEQ